MVYSEQDKIEISRCLSKLAILKGRPFSKEELAVFTEQCNLDGVPPKQISKACYEISKDNSIRFLSYDAIYEKVFPKLPEQEEALVAWEQINHYVRHSGYTVSLESLPFDGNIKRAISAIGGWQVICSCPSEQDLVWKKRAFLDHYKAAIHHQQIELSTQEYMRLSGQSALEIENNRTKVLSLVKNLSNKKSNIKKEANL